MNLNQIIKLIAYSVFFMVLVFIGLETMKTGKVIITDLNATRNSQLNNSDK